MDERQAINDLEYIRNIMREVRMRNAIDAIYYIIWGAVIPLCTVATWALLASGKETLIGWVWLTGMVLGGISCFIAGWLRSRRSEEGPPRPEVKMYFTAWILFGIVSIALMTVGWVFGKLTVPQVLFVLGMLLSLVYAVDATFSGLRWMYLVSAGWFVTGILSIFLKMPASSLVFGFTTIPLQLIPGIILNRIYRQEQHGTA